MFVAQILGHSPIEPFSQIAVTAGAPAGRATTMGGFYGLAMLHPFPWMLQRQELWRAELRHWEASMASPLLPRPLSLGASAGQGGALWRSSLVADGLVGQSRGDLSGRPLGATSRGDLLGRALKASSRGELSGERGGVALSGASSDTFCASASLASATRKLPYRRSHLRQRAPY